MVSKETQREIYRQYIDGLSPDEIAVERSIPLDEVECILRKQSVIRSTENARRLLMLRSEIEIHNQQLRREIQEEYGDKYRAAIGILLNNEDENVRAVGADQYRKSVSAEETPAPPPSVVIQNVQQTNVQAPPAYDGEAVVQRLLKAQREARGRFFGRDSREGWRGNSIEWEGPLQENKPSIKPFAPRVVRAWFSFKITLKLWLIPPSRRWAKDAFPEPALWKRCARTYMSLEVAQRLCDIREKAADNRQPPRTSSRNAVHPAPNLLQRRPGADVSSPSRGSSVGL